MAQFDLACAVSLEHSVRFAVAAVHSTADFGLHEVCTVGLDSRWRGKRNVDNESEGQRVELATGYSPDAVVGMARRRLDSPVVVN